MQSQKQILKRRIFDKLCIQTTEDNLPAQQCYEKYGFTYLESRKDIWGDMSRIYMRAL